MPQPKTHEKEKKLQIFFGLAIAMVVAGLITFVVLVVKDLQKNSPTEQKSFLHSEQRTEAV